MLDFLNTVTGFSTDGILPNVFDFLKPFAKLAGNVKDLLGLMPK
ncbi:PorA family porin [Corynebacterium choanae]|uniref:Uncharacterized protein n=1 Tax=Corynebacterium choanae TaxID=1862358 RepID=A0A3G6J9M6_9CORY|nr:PorA family porin [Corynebacterium choanae]AZA12734.1 hypothetical protein CCHOA_01530 [Corynebacterium choanae]